MPRKEKPRSIIDSALSLPQTFSYEVDATFEAVIQALADLEQDSRMFRRSSQEVSVLPAGQDYFFRARVRRYGSLTVTAEAQLSQDETGCIMIEGETRLHTWSSIGSLAMILLIGVLIAFATAPILLVPFLMSFVLGAGSTALIYRADRKRLLHALDQAIQEVSEGYLTEKHKRSVASLMLKETDQSDSVEELTRQQKAQR